ncbi:hypothetical protein [Virgibacillus pantothenticus]|uniref:hypothetical protein n=1 Tax=Virgibacillus pantothenticus TaxID=1473 RepID=UPI000986782E|nr:hypothetical protein [Virgibacillus pantothenticus]
MRFKKIRGWKRRIKQLEEWKKDSNFLDINFLRVYGVEYRKIFNFDEQYFIPNWFKREIVLSFIDVFKRWEAQAKDEFEEFYMCLHINETDIFNSEIIIVIADAINVYKSKFKKVENYIPMPDWIITFDNKEWSPYYLHSVWLQDEINSLSDADKRKLMKQLVRVNKNKVNSRELQEYIIRDSIFWCLDIEYI